jgi:hypothetical protein
MAHPLIKKGYFANTWKVQDKMYNWEKGITLVALGVRAVGVDNIQILENERKKTHRLKYVKVCGLMSKPQNQKE